LLKTSQIAGGFYSQKGHRQFTRQVVDMMLSAQAPYAALAAGTTAPQQYLQPISHANTRLE
tara:strand:+ start:265 stop:447 length:183 start_codon:yes stop_codon:yes gene_type:complete